MEHVATEPLSRMTFRSLATALGVSTYSFVYHFGSRQEMIDAILEEGVRQQNDARAGIDLVAFDREQFRDWYRQAFRHSLRESNRTGLRLQFEAGVLEPIDPDLGTRIGTAFADWRGTARSWLKKQGVETRRAGILARWLVDSAAGLQFGYLLSGDRTGAVAAFDVFLDAYLREALGE
jgi:AcrR family transcriptional regulator